MKQQCVSLPSKFYFPELFEQAMLVRGNSEHRNLLRDRFLVSTWDEVCWVFRLQVKSLISKDQSLVAFVVKYFFLQTSRNCFCFLLMNYVCSFFFCCFLDFFSVFVALMALFMNSKSAILSFSLESLYLFFFVLLFWCPDCFFSFLFSNKASTDSWAPSLSDSWKQTKKKKTIK